MIEISPDLFVGNDTDAISLLPSTNAEFAIVHCAKERWHRQFVNYKQRALPKSHPEYLYAIRGNEMALNMVDVDNPIYFADAMINAGLEFIRVKLFEGMKVLIHCNLGESRAAGMGMLSIRHELPDDFYEAEMAFRELYPAYNPKNGIREYLRAHWGNVCELQA